MPAKFLSLSVVFSALFVSQLVVAIPMSIALLSAVLHHHNGANIVNSVAGSTLVTLPGNCCPTCAPPPDCSAVQCLACPDNTVAVTVAGQCCPTCKPKPDCSDVLCVECVGEIEPGNCCPTCGLGAE
ncbi:hypothetical protein B0H13DRAFT_1909751 [Mycena leptocephala]|nr:hypothetical protein B0H13DRAFT_1909751 [Mycena leptocephala]